MHALIARPGFWALGGASRTLNVTYLRVVSVGETVEYEMVHIGKRNGKFSHFPTRRGGEKKKGADGCTHVTRGYDREV